MRYRTVLFDLDGTLVDSGAIILASFRHATQTVLGRELSDAEMLAGVGTPLQEQMRVFGPDLVDELVSAYRAHNAPLHAELQPCPGVLDVVAQLHEQGRRLGVVTAKSRKSTALAFERLPALNELFDVVVTADDTARHKPSPDPLLEALDRLDADADEAVYVGDAPFDVQAARAAGVAAIAVTWGRMHDRDRLERARPDAVVDTPEELLGRL